MPKQAVILAAGSGGRIRPFTAERPKSMLFVGNKPLVQYVIEALRQNGIRSIILVVGYRKERIFDFLGSGTALGVEITYITQSQQLGSADALLQAQEYIEGEFLVLPGDKYLKAVTLVPVLEVSSPAMLVKKVADPPHCSIVTVSGGVVEANLKPERRSSVLNSRRQGIFTVDTRIYSIGANFFNFLEGNSSIYSALNVMIASGTPVAAVETEGEWADLIYPWDILSVNGFVIGRTRPLTSGTVEANVCIRGRVNIGEGCTIRPGSCISGPAVIGSNCVIGPSVTISGPVSIGGNTVVEPFTYIANSVIGSNVHIGPGAIIQDSVIDEGTFIGSRFTVVSGEADIRIGGEYHHQSIGAMIGSGCRLGTGVTVQPGTIVGNYCQVKDVKVLSGDIPDKSLVI